jgi:membrane protease subunit HflK
MPWNEPGNNGNNNQQDPWGGKRDQNNPPDLDKILSDFIKKIRGFFKPGAQNNNNRSWQPNFKTGYGYGIGIAAAIIFLLWFFSGFYIVNPAEEAVVLRLGKYNETLKPGLHWMARFLDARYTVDVQKIYSFPLEGDFLTKSSDQNDLGNQISVDTTKKSNAASTDQSKNLVNVELSVQYRITNPRAYLFNVVDPDSTMQQVALGALSDVIGQMKLDDVLTTGRELLSSSVFDRAKLILANYNAGMEIVAVALRKVQAPDQVREAFNDVNRADQDRATTIQQAQAYASKVVPIAQGVAARILADANAYRQQVVLTAQANVARYQALLQAYQDSPDVTRQRLYLDTMQAILKNTTKVLVDMNSGSNLLYLPLDKLIQNSGKPTELPSENTMTSTVSAAATNHDDTSTNSSQTSGTEVKNESN